MQTQSGPDLRRLQADIDRLERGFSYGRGGRPPLRTGASDIDAVLPGGGLSRYGVHEVLSPSACSLPRRIAAAGAATGFVAALLARALAETQKPVLWCRRGADLYAPGLRTYGLPPDRLLLVHTADDTETLWAMEEALRSGAVAAVAGEADNPSHTAFRRLQLAAERAVVPGFLLRATDPERAAGPVKSRWVVRAAPSRPREADATWPGAPRFDTRLVCARGVPPRHWIMEWQYDDISRTPGRFAVVAGADDGAAVAVADDEPRRLSA